MKFIPVLLCSVVITAADTAAEETRVPDRERQVEEIVVTGSHLKREPRDLASPLTVLDKDDLDVDGAYDYYTHNPRGRIFYARYRLQL